MNQTKQSDQIFAGVFLIGLAILFLTKYWWPGVMFVIGAAMIARTVSEGHPWNSNHNALVTLGIGVVFAVLDVIKVFSDVSVGTLWPLILIGVGLYLLFGRNLRSQLGNSSQKSKNDDLL